MAITRMLSNHYHYQLMSGNINFNTDTFLVLLMSPTFTFDRKNHATLSDITEDAWVASTSYSLDDVVIPTTPNGHKYKCTTAGTSDSSEPTWPTGSGGTVGDGSVVWTEIGEDDQIPSGFGYTQNDKTLTGVSLIEDDDNDKGKATWDNPTWTADGDDVGPFGSAIIIDDTTADDTIVGCIDYGTDYTIPDGSSFQLQELEVNNADKEAS